MKDEILKYLGVELYQVGRTEKLTYKIIAGANRRNSGVMSKSEFSRWAKHEVIRDEDNWRCADEAVDETTE